MPASKFGTLLGYLLTAGWGGRALEISRDCFGYPVFFPSIIPLACLACDAGPLDSVSGVRRPKSCALLCAPSSPALGGGLA
jgi:hypothetical protein